MEHFFKKVTVEHFRVWKGSRHQIGKWLVSIDMAFSMFPHRTTQVCVVDDFGNLVAVPS